MPQAPYAEVRVSLDGGAVQTGGITATGGEVVQLSANPAGLVGATQYLWELLNFPPEFTEPSGWDTDGNGNYFSTLQTPPPFTLLGDEYFDKYVLRLTLNGGGPALDRNATAAQIAAKEALVDTRTAISVPHVSGIEQIAAYEGNQFSNKGWVGGLRETVRYLAGLIGGGSTLPAPGTAGNVLTSSGSDWVSGAAGAAAFTTTTAPFTQPAVSANVTAQVASSAGIVVGSDVFVAGGGYYLVASIPDGTHIQLTNRGYSANATPGATIGSAARVSPTGPAGADGADGPPATLYDATEAALTADANLYSAGTIEWRRVGGRNKPFLRGKVALRDHGVRISTNSGATANATSGSTTCTLGSAADFLNGDHVALMHAGATHTMMQPPAFTAQILLGVLGTPGTTTREYCFAWVDEQYGVSQASAVVTILNAPDILSDPYSSDGMGTTGDGSFIRLFPKYVDCEFSFTTNVVLSGIQTGDGIAGGASVTVMCLGQTDPAENGPWVQAAGAWSRPTGFAVSGDLAQGMICRVKRGTLRRLTLWQLATGGPYTLGTTGLSFTQNTAKIGAVWTRTGGAGSWELAGGFTANSYLPGLPVQFIDMGHRPSGNLTGTLPFTTPPASALPRLLRTTIVSGGGTTTLTLANAAVSTVAAQRLVHDNTTPWTNCYAEAVAKDWAIELPEGEWQIWSDILIDGGTRTLAGQGMLRSTIRFGAGYGMTLGDSAANSILRDFQIATVTRSLPAGTMIAVPTEEASVTNYLDTIYHGAGLTIRSNDTTAERVRVQGMYGSGFIIRGSASEGTNANRVKLVDCDASSNYGHGLQTTGPDANICRIGGFNAINNWGEGITDCSFLGCTFEACHVSGSLRRAYSNRDLNTCFSVFKGCYAEAGSNRPVRLKPPGVWIGGDNGVGFDASVVGTVDTGSNSFPRKVITYQSPGTWTASSRRLPEAHILPTVRNGFVYKCVHSVYPGQLTGATEPTWPLTPGATVVDGNITWQNTGKEPALNIELGRWGDSTVLNISEDGAPSAIAHTLEAARSSGYLFWQFVGNVIGHAFRLKGLGSSAVERFAGLLHYPWGFVTGASSSLERAFAFTWGTPSTGTFEKGDTFLDQSTGRVYRPQSSFGLGASAWVANTNYKKGSIVRPTVADGFVYIQTAAVTTANLARSHATTEPTWPSSGSVTDNQCVWTRFGADSGSFGVSVDMLEGGNLTNADVTIQVSQGSKRTLLVPITANRVIRIAATGATKGEALEVVRIGGGNFTLTVKDDVSGTDLYVFPASAASPYPARAADFSFDATNWQGPLTGGGNHTAIVT